MSIKRRAFITLLGGAPVPLRVRSCTGRVRCSLAGPWRQANEPERP